MESIIWVIHTAAALGVIGLVLLQHGKGADMGAAFGSGSSGSLFGVSGTTNLLSRSTAVLVAIFFTTSLTLAYFSGHRGKQSSVVNLQTKTQQAPAANANKLPEAPPSKAQDVPK